MVVDPTCFTKGASPSLNDVILTKQTKLLYVRIPTIITVVLVMYRDVAKVFGHCDFLLYISCKTTFFKNIIPKSTLVDFDDFFTNKNRIKCNFTL